MAFSSYLTDDKWDACFYASFGASAAPDLSTSMHRTVDLLLARGYRFRGLDERGNRMTSVTSNNGKKLCLWLGNPYKVDAVGLMNSGRSFLKKHAPDLLGETDEEWAAQQDQIRREWADDEPETEVGRGGDGKEQAVGGAGTQEEAGRDAGGTGAAPHPGGKRRRARKGSSRRGV